MWLSVCSAHQDHDPMCTTCNTGHWVAFGELRRSERLRLNTANGLIRDLMRQQLGEADYCEYDDSGCCTNHGRTHNATLCPVEAAQNYLSKLPPEQPTF